MLWAAFYEQWRSKTHQFWNQKHFLQNSIKKIVLACLGAELSDSKIDPIFLQDFD